MNAATAIGISSTPAPLDANPLRPSVQATPTDRYGADAAVVPPAATTPLISSDSGTGTSDVAATPSTAPPAAPSAIATAPPTSPVEQSFVESWPGIQAMLDRGELTEAHKALSKWYDDPSLTPTDAERVDTLLSQLAGTVVYSTEHRLAPAYVVKQGETLETIAKEHNVPWQLLAKINGIAAVDQVRPGQELKVVRGPFSAVVDLSRNQLTLMVDERYAGRFPVNIPPGQAVNDGEWFVGKKSNEQAPGRALLLQGKAASPGAPTPQLVIASDSIAVNSADGTVIKLPAKDAEELSDILSIGSRVITRR
jgi:LysM repeat protein